MCSVRMLIVDLLCSNRNSMPRADGCTGTDTDTDLTMVITARRSCQTMSVFSVEQLQHDHCLCSRRLCGYKLGNGDGAHDVGRVLCIHHSASHHSERRSCVCMCQWLFVFHTRSRQGMRICGHAFFSRARVCGACITVVKHECVAKCGVFKCAGLMVDTSAYTSSELVAVLSQKMKVQMALLASQRTRSESTSTLPSSHLQRKELSGVVSNPCISTEGTVFPMIMTFVSRDP